MADDVKGEGEVELATSRVSPHSALAGEAWHCGDYSEWARAATLHSARHRNCFSHMVT